jgi:hypothetical protein
MKFGHLEQKLELSNQNMRKKFLKIMPINEIYKEKFHPKNFEK